MRNWKLAKRILVWVAFVYVLISYQVLIDRVISVNENSVFYQLDKSGLFMPGYLLGMVLGLVGGTGWAIVGEIITFAGIYLFLDLVLSIFKRMIGEDQKD